MTLEATPTADDLPPDEALTAKGPLPDLVRDPAIGDAWVAEAVKEVEAAIAELVAGFVQQPYIHRVEHSWHVRLMQLLSESKHLAGSYPIGASGFKTQLIHKEWPETIAQPGTKRGSFDVAILTPNQLEHATLEQFRFGRIAAPIVIEMGFGYWDSHLLGDQRKLADSGVQHGYLVLLSRTPSRKRPQTEDIVRSLTGAKVAYVHHDIVGRRVFARGLDGTEIVESSYLAS